MSESVNLNNEEQELLQILKSMPPVVKPTPKITDTSYQPCASCNKQTYIGDFKIFDSGVVDKVISPLCSKCQSTFGDFGKLVCCGCNTVIGWMEPQKDKDGFEFKKFKSYHIRSCPSCSPGLEKAEIIEKILYLRQLNKSINYHE
jgi:hypothetical protein